jgi:hypothetical protein
MPDESNEVEQGPQIVIEPAQLGGVWANFAQVTHSDHEFTLDFVRMDYTAPSPGRGIVVARVAVSPLFITQLIDALQSNWQTYAEKAMPREIHGDGPNESEG